MFKSILAGLSALDESVLVSSAETWRGHRTENEIGAPERGAENRVSREAQFHGDSPSKRCRPTLARRPRNLSNCRDTAGRVKPQVHFQADFAVTPQTACGVAEHGKAAPALSASRKERPADPNQNAQERDPQCDAPDNQLLLHVLASDSWRFQAVKEHPGDHQPNPDNKPEQANNINGSQLPNSLFPQFSRNWKPRLQPMCPVIR